MYHDALRGSVVQTTTLGGNMHPETLTLKTLKPRVQIRRSV